MKEIIWKCQPILNINFINLPQKKVYTANLFLNIVLLKRVLVIIHVSRNPGRSNYTNTSERSGNLVRFRRREKAKWGTKRKADLVTTARSFLRLSAPGFSFWTSPFFGNGFFCCLWRAALMASAQFLGCSWGVIKWIEIDAGKQGRRGGRRGERKRKNWALYWVTWEWQTWEFCIDVESTHSRTKPICRSFPKGIPETTQH